MFPKKQNICRFSAIYLYEYNFRNGCLAPINIQLVVLHVEVVLIKPKISHYLFQITGFGGYIGWPPGGYPNLYAVVF